MSEKSRLVKNTGIIALGNFGAKMVSFLLLPLYTSILTTEEYGVYDYIVAISAFLLPIVTMSMHEAMFRFIIDSGKEGEDFKKTISNSFFVVILGIVACAGIMYGIHCFNENINDLFYVWLYVTASALYTFSNNLLRGLGKIKEYAIVSSGKNILQLVLNVLVVAVFRWGMMGLLFSLCISEALAFIIVALISKIYKYIKIRYININQLKDMLKYSVPLIPNALCAQIIHLSDRIVINGYMGASSNGIYAVSYKFPNMIETVHHYFYTAWSESASRVFAKGKEKAEEYYQSLYDSINNLIFSIVIMMIAGMPILFRIFVKGNYIDGFKYIPILMLSIYLDCLAKFFSGIFTALKKTKVLATSTIIAAVVNLLINILLIKEIGLYAAAGSTLIAEIVLVIFRKFFISKDINITIDKKRFFLEIIIVALVFILYDYNNWIKIGTSILITVLYALYSNRQLVQSAVNGIKNKLRKV